MAAQAGADAIGLIFAESPRRVSVAQAKLIVAALPAHIAAVGVFVNAQPQIILSTITDVGLSEVQLHGDETSNFIDKLGDVPATKALRVRDESFVDEIRSFQSAGLMAILLDAYSKEKRGGSGKRLDWNLIVDARQNGALKDAPPIILSGGLTAENVAEGIRLLQPWGVDVSTGVEESPGIKSAEKIKQFIAAVRSA